MRVELVIESADMFRNLRFGRLEPENGCLETRETGGSYLSGELGFDCKNIFFGKRRWLGRANGGCGQESCGRCFRNGSERRFHLATLLQTSGPVFASNLAKWLILWAILLDCVRHGQ
jgi:hypothetical protein